MVAKHYEQLMYTKEMSSLGVGPTSSNVGKASIAARPASYPRTSPLGTSDLAFVCYQLSLISTDVPSRAGGRAWRRKIGLEACSRRGSLIDCDLEGDERAV